MYTCKYAEQSVCLYRISVADPGGILLISSGRNRWLATAVIIFDSEKQIKDVSTIIGLDLYITCQKPQKRRLILKGRFSFSIERLLYPCCVTWQGVATTFGAQQHHAKRTNSSSFLAKRYAANNCCVVFFPTDRVGSGVLTQEFNFNFSFFFNMNSLDLHYSVFRGRNFAISPLKSSKTNRELLQPGPWPATDFFKIHAVTCNDLLANILDLWRNHLRMWKQFNCKDLSYNVQS